MDEIFKKFDDIEKKLRGAIKKLPSEIQDCEDATVLKKRIKNYIEKVNELKVLLDEYESIAMQIQKISSSKINLANDEIKNLNKVSQKDKVSKPQTEKLEQTKKPKSATENATQDDKEQLDKYEDIIENGKVVGQKKKVKPVKEY